MLGLASTELEAASLLSVREGQLSEGTMSAVLRLIESGVPLSGTASDAAAALSSYQWPMPEMLRQTAVTVFARSSRNAWLQWCASSHPVAGASIGSSPRKPCSLPILSAVRELFVRWRGLLMRMRITAPL